MSTAPQGLPDLHGNFNVHDQLRLQRYSLQLAVRFKIYYKGLFLGLVDLALVNAFIVYNHARIAENKAKVSHVAFMKQLHLELCQISPSDWEGFLHLPGQVFTPTRQRAAATSTHMPIQTEDTRKGNTEGSKKRRQRACKVCSLLKDKGTGGDTSYKCSTCVLIKTDEKTGTALSGQLGGSASFEFAPRKKKRWLTTKRRHNAVEWLQT
ncbi:Hypothetical protein PHPALM_9323 [Phytophthora palmivora]|uniref:PiggyBac transposable element-derived protein domain-containing protein n=1 Tax=Phytophthora palmivora TaxID=4796 RepID=A0A2P4Y7L6_9STRA|nr:Hypothetical protein PHPALM_9323 [Phytophthora palmivora]